MKATREEKLEGLLAEVLEALGQEVNESDGERDPLGAQSCDRCDGGFGEHSLGCRIRTATSSPAVISDAEADRLERVRAAGPELLGALVQAAAALAAATDVDWVKTRFARKQALKAALVRARAAIAKAEPKP